MEGAWGAAKDEGQEDEPWAVLQRSCAWQGTMKSAEKRRLTATHLEGLEKTSHLASVFSGKRSEGGRTTPTSHGPADVRGWQRRMTVTRRLEGAQSVTVPRSFTNSVHNWRVEMPDPDMPKEAG